MSEPADIVVIGGVTGTCITAHFPHPALAENRTGRKQC